MHLITACVRSTTEGYILTCVCLFSGGGGGGGTPWPPVPGSFPGLWSNVLSGGAGEGEGISTSHVLSPVPGPACMGEGCTQLQNNIGLPIPPTPPRPGQDRGTPTHARKDKPRTVHLLRSLRRTFLFYLNLNFK